MSWRKRWNKWWGLSFVVLFALGAAFIVIEAISDFVWVMLVLLLMLLVFVWRAIRASYNADT